MFDQIEKLKQDLTDKYVVVDASRPELARFDGFTGLVKTVNMSGRALVEFDAWNNIGWYDIDVDYLKVVPKPAPKVEEPAAKKAPAAKAAPAAAKPAAGGEKKLSPLEMARQQGAAKSAGGGAAKPAAAKPAGAAPAAGKKQSTADILAAARANKAAAAAPPAAKVPPAAEEEAPAAEAAPVPAKPAAKPAKPAAPAKASGGRLSVAEQLAWCREHDAK